LLKAKVTLAIEPKRLSIYKKEITSIKREINNKKTMTFEIQHVSKLTIINVNRYNIF